MTRPERAVTRPARAVGRPGCAGTLLERAVTVPARALTRSARDEGSVLVLTIGLVAVLLLLVGVVVDVSAVVLAKRSLAAATDGAAVSAAQAIDQAVFEAQGPAAGVPLSEGGVAQRVADYPAPPGVTLTGSVEGGLVAVVAGHRDVRVPFGGWLGVGDVGVDAVARARSPLVP